MKLRTTATRTLAAAGVLGLAVSGAAVVPEGTARAAGGGGAGAGAVHAITGLPHDATFTLAPQLAALLGQSTVTSAEARELLAERGSAARPGAPSRTAAETPEVGAKRLWPALDASGRGGIPPIGIYLKEYTLQSKNDAVEIWVASGTDAVSSGTQFPAGDCRVNDVDPTVVTKAQTDAMAEEFRTVMLPKSTEVFSEAPQVNGTRSVGQLPGTPLDFRGSGDSVVTLVDNVRDPNFYDFENNLGYIAGFFAPIFNVLTDRNVMTIDAYDWTHRTGENPPQEPSEDICKSRPSRPRAYEGTFIHEYQHLLMSYTDPAEVSWVNEGLSDIVPALVGYADARKTVHEVGGDAHMFCFQGYGEVKGVANPNPRPCGGPQNSLTIWEDEGTGSEVFADYGIAWSILAYGFDRYGPEFLTTLHRDGERQGLAGLQATLEAVDPGTDVMDFMHDFQLMNLLDRFASGKGVKLTGTDKKTVTTKSLDVEVNLDHTTSYVLPGAAPNGTDYVRLRSGDEAVRGADLTSLTFSGARNLDTSQEEGRVAGTSDGPAIENWMVRLVGIDRDGKRALVKTYDEAFDLKLGAKALKAFRGYDEVVAVVSHDDSRELLFSYAPYTLTVNDVVQPGGS